MKKNNKTQFCNYLIALIAIPLAISAVPIHHKATHAYIGATPNPIGVGQETLIHLGITDELQLVQYGWEGLTVTVTEPDNTTETLGPFRTDSTGGTGTFSPLTKLAPTTYKQTSLHNGSTGLKRRSKHLVRSKHKRKTSP